jgi:hypothetical protein
MNIIEEIIKNQKEEDCFFEMANIKSRETGLPYDIWIDSMGSRRNIPHNTPRIKVDVNGERIPVLISKEDIKCQKDFLDKAKIVNWIKDNYETLIRHWNGEISDFEAITLLIK